MEIKTQNDAIAVLAQTQIAEVERVSRQVGHLFTLQAAVLALIEQCPDRAAFRAAFSAHYEAARETNLTACPQAVPHMEVIALAIHGAASRT